MDSLPLTPIGRFAADRCEGQGRSISNDLGFAPQAIAYHASGTKERNFKTHASGSCSSRQYAWNRLYLALSS